MSLRPLRLPGHTFGALSAFHVSSLHSQRVSHGASRSKEAAQTTGRGASTVSGRGPRGHYMAWPHDGAVGPSSTANGLWVHCHSANLFLKCSTGTKWSLLHFITVLLPCLPPPPAILFLVSAPMQLTSGSPSYPGQTDSSHCWLC